MIIGRIEIKDYVLRILPKKVAHICIWCEGRFKTRNIGEFNGYCSKECLDESTAENKRRSELLKKAEEERERLSRIARGLPGKVPIIGAKKDEGFSHGHASTGVYGGFRTTTYDGHKDEE